MLAAAVVATALSLTTYHGPAQKGAVPGSRSYALTIAGRPGSTVRLRALGVPAGFIVSFCTPRICAPFAVPLTLPATGRTTIEVQLIRNDVHAHVPRTLSVASDDGSRATIAAARGTVSAP